MGCSPSRSYMPQHLGVDNQGLIVDDSASRGVKLLSEPNYKEPVENCYGAYRGERR